MKKSSLNRKFRRALAASLGAIAFASTSCVINAVVDPMLYKQREVAEYFADLANVNVINSGVNVGAGAGAHQADVAAQRINNVMHIIIGGKPFALDDTKLTQKHNKRDYEFPMTLNGEEVGTIRLKRQTDGPPLAKHYRLCPPIADAIPDAHTLYPTSGAAYAVKVNKWVQEKWLEYYTDLDNQIKNLEKEEAKKAEENAKAERERLERANSLMNNSGNQTVQTPTNNNMNTLLSGGILTSGLVTQSLLTNSTPVQSTTSSMVNTGNAMGTQVGSKADINNTNPQISRNAQKTTDKFKT